MGCFCSKCLFGGGWERSLLLRDSPALRTWRQFGAFEVDFGDAEGLFEFLDPPASSLDLVSARARLGCLLFGSLAVVVSVTFVVAFCAGSDRVAPRPRPLVNVASLFQLEIIIAVFVVSVSVSVGASASAIA